MEYLIPSYIGESINLQEVLTHPTIPPILCIGIRGIANELQGTLPTLILEALAQEPSHGYRIAQGIKERSEGVLDFKEGTLYPALHKLENEGLVESYESVENGRPRRYYRITKTGHTTLTKDRAEWRQLSRAVTTILGSNRGHIETLDRTCNQTLVSGIGCPSARRDHGTLSVNPRSRNLERCFC